MNSMELRHKAFGVLQTMQGIVGKASTEARELTGEEIGTWQAAKADYDRLVSQIEVLEATDRLTGIADRSLGTVAGPNAWPNQTARTGRKSEEYRRALMLASAVGKDRLGTGAKTALEAGFEEQAGYRSAFWGWAREGFDGVQPEQRDELRSGFQSATPEMRALSAGISTAGGYLIPDEDQLAIVTAQKRYGGMLEVCQVLTTNTGAEIPIPTSDDTSNVGEQVGENTAVSEQDLTVGQKMLATYLFSTKMIKASLTLIQDAPTWFEGWLQERIAERRGRILNTKWTTGSGAATIEGILSKTTAGLTTASATAITRGEVVDLEHSVEPAYRVGARFMLNDAVLAYLKKLENTNIKQFPELSPVGGEATINAYPFTINQDMDSTVAASKKTMLFGNFQNYLCRNVSGMVMLRLVERYAEYGQVAFIGFSRHGGVLVDAGQHPIKHMLQHA